MPEGKPANTRCVQLSDTNLHDLWLAPAPEGVLRPQPTAEMCGSTRQQAITYLLELSAHRALNVFDPRQAAQRHDAHHQRNPEHRMIVPDFSHNARQ